MFTEMLMIKYQNVEFYTDLPVFSHLNSWKLHLKITQLHND